MSGFSSEQQLLRTARDWYYKAIPCLNETYRARPDDDLNLAISKMITEIFGFDIPVGKVDVLEFLNSKGWYLQSFFYPALAQLFLSSNPEIVVVRDQFIHECGGAEKLRFIVIPQTGSVVMFVYDPMRRLSSQAARACEKPQHLTFPSTSKASPSSEKWQPTDSLQIPVTQSVT